MLKKTIPLALASLLLLGSYQPAPAPLRPYCCHPIEEFAELASNADFRMAHDEPVARPYRAQAGEMVSFKTADGKEAKAYLVKAQKQSNRYLFVIHEWWGLNDHIKQEADKFAKDLPNVNILALDMYDGQVTDKREEAGKLMQAMSVERGKVIVEGARDYAGKKAKIATIGWCFGGGWSLQATLLLGKQAKGCIMYYGMPEKDKTRLKALKTEVLGIFARQEKWITNEIVDTFEKDMKEAGKAVTIKKFEADHAFANPSNPRYNAAFAQEAYSLSLAFLKKKLK
jgi:carboxymethylenebutenolidase